MGRPSSKVTKVVVSGPLAPFTDAYKVRLEQAGYRPLSIVNELRQVAHLSRWMEAGGLGAAELTFDHVGEFLEPRRAGKGHGACSFQGLVPMVQIVNSGAGPGSPVGSGVEAVVDGFHRYLLQERGLAGCTAGAYVSRARRFLDDGPVGGVGVLGSGDVIGAVRAEVERVSVGSAQFYVAALRAFLRYAFVEGLTDTDLSGAALAVTGRRRTSLPRGISGADAAALLSSCDRRRSIGRRDHAVLLVLLRLGLRAGEVASLTLADLDWRAAEVVVRGKGGPRGSAAVTCRRRRSNRRLPVAGAPANNPAGGVPASTRACGAADPGRGVGDRPTQLCSGRHGTGGCAPFASHRGLRSFGS
jgi:integrase/recombinase XerD